MTYDRQAHFHDVAPVYEHLRTTDAAPIAAIAERLAGTRTWLSADIGCGTGRYSIPFLQQVPLTSLYCVDENPAMLAQIEQHGALNGLRRRLIPKLGSAMQLPFGNATMDCLLTFNAIHHFEATTFFREAARVLRLGGFLFVYTRTRWQNAQSVWGQHFPQFAEREVRLYERDELTATAARARGLQLVGVQEFTYPRHATLDALVAQARGHHYSTFALYTPREFASALAAFTAALPDTVEWHDRNTLFTFQKGDDNA